MEHIDLEKMEMKDFLKENKTFGTEVGKTLLESWEISKKYT